MKKLIFVMVIVLFSIFGCEKNSTGSGNNNNLTVPSNPSPANGSSDINVNSILSWTCSDDNSDALTYDVYFGADPTLDEEELVSQNQSESNFDPGTLQQDTTYYWKIVAYDGEYETSSPVWSFMTMVLTIPSNPYPANGSSDINVNSILSWTCSDPDGIALTYDVYFGTDPTLDDGELVSQDQNESNFDPETLENETTYYWKIVAYNGEYETSSPVWSFMTMVLTIHDLQIADDFNFTTHRDVEVTFRALYAGVFYIYDMEDNLLKKGKVDLHDGYQSTVSIPNDVNDVKLSFSEVENLEANYTITGDIIEYDFYPPSEEERGIGTRSGNKIHPILECVVSNGDGTWTAHFGYLNEGDNISTINIGVQNKFIGTPDEDMGQPTIFVPGRHEFDFSIAFIDGDNFVWSLSGPLGEGDARATASSPECPRGSRDDADGDGILNDDDDFPSDENRAFKNFYPVADDRLAMGTLAFEDRWPMMGDYDFNDVIINYRFETVDDPSDHLLEVYGYFTLRASGSAYENGFAIEMPFLESNVETLTYTDLTGASVTGGDNSEILIFFSNALEVMNKPENSTFVNTDNSDPYLEPVNFGFYLKLTEAVDESIFPWLEPPYNPFIIVNQNTGKEIHLPDMPPTILADPALFGTGDDDSDFGSDRYYKTATNLPWAINIPIEWTYPLERIQIIDAYNYFDDWAESSGAFYNDWFENSEGYIVEENLYIEP